MARYRFADVELDVDRFVVTRAGQRRALEPKALEVLRVLVERPGRLVSRDELLDAAWPGVAVTPNALTRVVAQLRRELGDEAGDAKYIETVPTRGYRFIAPVDVLPAAVSAGPVVPAPARGPASPAYGEPPPLAVPAPGMHRRRVGWASVALAAGAAAVVAAVLLARSGPPVPAAPATADPAPIARIAGEAGEVSAAIFSPDGRWLALVSDRSGDDEIYRRDLSAATSTPVTADGMRNVHPSWSPDGSAIAYHSVIRKGIWVIPVAGGAARQVAALGSRPAWSPDGAWIAFQSDELLADMAQPGSRLWIAPADGRGPARPLTTEGDPPGGHGAPLWAPSGAEVYFMAFRNGPIDIWSVRVATGLVTKRTSALSFRLQALVPTPSGLSAIGPDRFMGARTLLSVPVGDEAPLSPLPTILADLPDDILGLSLAPGGRTAAVVVADYRKAVRAVPVTAAGAPRGEPRTIGDGGHPAVSPDGAWVAYDRGAEVHVVAIDGSADRVVRTGGRRAAYPTWRSARSLFLLRWTGLEPVLVDVDLETGAVTDRVRLPEAATFPRVAPDGDTLLVTLGEPLDSLLKGSVSAGTYAPWTALDGYAFGVWSPDGRLIALERKVGPDMPMYVADARTLAARPVSAPRGQYWPGSFSPDGKYIATAVVGPDGVWNIESIEVATGARIPVTHATSTRVVGRYPAWSPRGDLIVYDETTTAGAPYLLTLTRPAAR
ncbi:MAG: winged helix-turn-helix domain-containing protein [Vicinamibacterales bacterium]